MRLQQRPGVTSWGPRGNLSGVGLCELLTCASIRPGADSHFLAVVLLTADGADHEPRDVVRVDVMWPFDDESVANGHLHGLLLHHGVLDQGRLVIVVWISGTFLS